MQKKIIALAIAGLSTAAFAQSNVQIYGNIDASIVQYSGTSTGVAGTTPATATSGTGSITKMDQNLIKQSRLGFRGEEALGGGTKALFTGEWGFHDGSVAAQQAGTTGFAGAARQMFVGMQSNIGTVTFGRQYTPFFTTAAAVDNFGMTGVANLGNIHATAGQTVRFSSAVKYVSPTFSGLTAQVAVGMPETASNATTKQTAQSMALVYGNGPIVAAWANVTLKDVDTSNAGTAANIITGSKLRANVFGGTYNMGVAKLGAAYVITKMDGNSSTYIDARGWNLNATVPMGAHSFKIAYNKVDDRNSTTTPGALTTNEDATHWGLGYQYDMSKRTSLHVQYGKVKNSNGSTYGVDPRTTLSAAGIAGGNNGGTSREKGLVFGMNHEF